jgi:hypothetical protein
MGEVELHPDRPRSSSLSSSHIDNSGEDFGTSLSLVVRARATRVLEGPAIGESASSSFDKWLGLDRGDEANDEALDSCLTGGGGESPENRSNGSTLTGVALS